MIDHKIQLEYIKEKLIFIKLQVELDTKSGLFDINKYGEDIFMCLLSLTLASVAYKLKKISQQQSLKRQPRC